MGFCITHADINTDKKADEIIFDLSLKTDFVVFYDYIKKLGPDKKYVFRYNDIYNWIDSDFSEIKTFLRSFKNSEYYFVVSFPGAWETCIQPFEDFLNKEGILYFYQEPCFNLEDLNYMIKRGASEFYIHGELAFNLQKIQPLRKTKKFRICPDDPCKMISETNFDFTKLFWFTPQEVEIYANYADSIEIAYRPEIKLDLYRIKKWDGKISDIISNCKSNVFCSALPPLGEYRTKCGLRCIYDDCDFCKKAFEFAEVLQSHNLEIGEKNA